MDDDLYALIAEQLSDLARCYRQYQRKGANMDDVE